jgi:hypothetical protein
VEAGREAEFERLNMKSSSRALSRCLVTVNATPDSAIADEYTSDRSIRSIDGLSDFM